MPTYKYECKPCGKSYEQVRAISDPEKVVLCESCGQLAKRVYGVGMVSFNGSGFYSNDKKNRDL